MAKPETDLLDRTLANVEVFDGLAALLFAAFAGVPSAAGGPPTTVPTIIVELVWARLLRRGTVAPPDGPEVVAVEDVIAAAWTALPDPNPEALSESDPTGLEADIHRRFSVHGLYVYDPAIPILEGERWPQLFADFDDDLREAAGLRVETVRRLVELLQEGSVAWCLAYARASRQPQSAAEMIALMREGAAQGIGAVIEPGLASNLTPNRAQLARGAEVGIEEVDAFCDLLATQAPLEGADRPFEHLVWELRRQPILEWEDRLLAPVISNVNVAVRPALERVLRERRPKATDAYGHAKAKWVEERALELLGRALEPDQTYRTLEIAEGGGGDSEHDGLLRLDLTGIAVEVKGGGVSPAARRGQPSSQDKVVQALLHDALAQADRTIDALAADESITGIDVATGDREVVDIGDVTEFVPLIVTLEDLSGVVGSFEAVFGDRPAEEPYPIVLALDDLVWYAEELGSPARFMHYLRVRERIGRSQTRLVVFDEADWFRMYLAHGGAGIQETLEAFDGLGIPILAQGGTARRGYPEPAAGRWDTPFAELLERWARERSDGWLTASMAMLDLADDQAERLGAALQENLALARREEALTSVTIFPRGDPRRPIHVLTPHGSKSLSLQELGQPMHARAPEAVEHIVLGAFDGDPQNLRFVAVLSVAQAPNETGG